jgi:hypothetical protein
MLRNAVPRQHPALPGCYATLDHASTPHCRDVTQRCTTPALRSSQTQHGMSSVPREQARRPSQDAGMQTPGVRAVLGAHAHLRVPALPTSAHGYTHQDGERATATELLLLPGRHPGGRAVHPVRATNTSRRSFPINICTFNKHLLHILFRIIQSRARRAGKCTPTRDTLACYTTSTPTPWETHIDTQHRRTTDTHRHLGKPTSTRRDTRHRNTLACYTTSTRRDTRYRNTDTPPTRDTATPRHLGENYTDTPRHLGKTTPTRRDTLGKPHRHAATRDTATPRHLGLIRNTTSTRNTDTPPTRDTATPRRHTADTRHRNTAPPWLDT